MIDYTKLRAYWAAKQGLDGSLQGATPADIVLRSGWLRSFGGSSSYLTLFSRGGCSLDQVTKAVENQEIAEMHSARGCIYVVPFSQQAMSLALAKPSVAKGQEAVAKRKLGVTEEEIINLSAAIYKALKSGPLTNNEIKEAVSDHVRHFGEEGKKLGQTTNLACGLQRLQVEGKIIRELEGSRLEASSLRYKIVENAPPAIEFDEAASWLASEYFRWIGPAKLDEFAKFASLSQKAAVAATTQLEMEDIGGGYMLPRSEQSNWESFRVPSVPHYSLVGNGDNLVLLRRNLGDLVATEDQDRKTYCGKTAAESTMLGSAWHHLILDRGQVIGMWDHDLDKEEIVTLSWHGVDSALKDAIAKTQAFVKSIGDAKSDGMDNAKVRTKRLDFLRSNSGA